jgi:hypothetical protein
MLLKGGGDPVPLGLGESRYGLPLRFEAQTTLGLPLRGDPDVGHSGVFCGLFADTGCHADPRNTPMTVEVL